MCYEKLTQVQSQIVVGTKQCLKAIRNNLVKEVYIATDADEKLTGPVIELAEAFNIPINCVDSKKKLGAACGIEVGTSAVARKK